MDDTQSVYILPHGTLEYRPCPFAGDIDHIDHVRDAYNAALPYLKHFCTELKADGWHDKHFSLHDKVEVCLQRPEGSSWSTTYIMLPRTADMFFSQEYALQLSAMFAKCAVVYDPEDLTLPRIWNAPEPLVNIINLLQCVLRGQLFFTAQLPNGLVAHANYYPTKHWTETHGEPLMVVTLAFLGLDIEDRMFQQVALHIIDLFCEEHRIIPVIGSMQNAEALVHRVHRVPFRWPAQLLWETMEYYQSQQSPDTTPTIALRQLTPCEGYIYVEEPPTTPARESTPLLSSASSSPVSSESHWSSSPPSSPAENYYSAAEEEQAEPEPEPNFEYERECSVEIPPSEAAYERECSVLIPPTEDGYESDIPYPIHSADGHIMSGEQNPTVASEGQEEDPSRMWEPSERYKREHTFYPSKQYLSKDERCFLPSDAWEAFHVQGQGRPPKMLSGKWKAGPPRQYGGVKRQYAAKGRLVKPALPYPPRGGHASREPRLLDRMDQRSSSAASS